MVRHEIGPALGAPPLLDAAFFHLVGEREHAVLGSEEVIVEEKHDLFVHRLDLVADLLGGQKAGLVLVELPGRTEIAVKTAATAGRHRRHRPGHCKEVLVAVTPGQKIPPRRREGVEIAILIALFGAVPGAVGQLVAQPIDAAEILERTAAVEMLDQLGKGLITLADAQCVDVGILEIVRRERRMMLAHERETVPAQRLFSAR